MNTLLGGDDELLVVPLGGKVVTTTARPLGGCSISYNSLAKELGRLGQDQRARCAANEQSQGASPNTLLT